MSVFNRCGVHAVCAAFLNLLSQLGPPPPLHQHVTQVKMHCVRRTLPTCCLTLLSVTNPEDRGSVEEERRRMQVVEKFQTAPFEEIAAQCGARTSQLQSKLDQVFDLIIRPPPSPSGHSPPRSTPLHEMKFPDLCVY
ncbi:Protein EFR3-like protein B [Nibea albiflora]|uniref:Protein EFR3-like protein B n=1 Tax=Nibea albiflora TaxID=240163 RepID=A0ACB7EQE2_NIBAL|nr:Protein EFR3-like protein B [Nibea albiflora]